MTNEERQLVDQAMDEARDHVPDGDDVDLLDWILANRKKAYAVVDKYGFLVALARYPISLRKEKTMSTKSERETLIQICQMRAKVAKADPVSRSATLKADCEAQLAAIYKWDQDDIWRQATIAVKEAVESGNRQIAERCHELGIPAEFQPRIETYWSSRGENASASRRAELRKVAYSKIDEKEKQAKLAIDRQSVEIQTQLLAEGLTSEEGHRWLERLPTAQQLMPPLNLVEIRKQLRQGRAKSEA